MSVWVDIIKGYDKFGTTPIGTTVKEEYTGRFVMRRLSVFYDSLPPLSSRSMIEEINRFDFSDYYDAGYQDNGLDVLYQNNENYDLIMKNVYVDVNPFRLKVYHNDKIYLPNIKFINCVVNRYNGVYYAHISDEKCVYNQIWKEWVMSKMWFDMINMYEKYGIIPQGVDIKEHVLIINGSVKTVTYVINIYDDRLYKHGPINKVVSNFNISDYKHIGVNSEGETVFSQENSHDIRIENMYLNDAPFQVYYFIEDRMYIPNILYKKCCVTIEKGTIYMGIDYLDCVMKEV